MESAEREQAGLSLDTILNCFRENHFVDSAEINLGIIDGSAGFPSIKICAPKTRGKVEAFFSYFNSLLPSLNLAQVEIRRTSTEVLPNGKEATTYAIYPRLKQYAVEGYAESARELLRKLPHFLRDFHQKRL